MNTENSTPEKGTELQPVAPTPQPPTNRTRTGKIARLPKAVRDKINTMLDDGVPYLKIIEALGPDGINLSEANLSNWKAGGYLEWLRGRQIIEALQSKYELAEDIVQRATDPNAPGRALLQVIATNVCRFLSDTDPATLNENLFADPDKFTRFVNAMVRLADGTIKYDVHTTQAQDRATAAQLKNPKKGISPTSLQAAEEALNLL